jgi:hypothetical protein
VRQKNLCPNSLFNYSPNSPKNLVHLGTAEHEILLNTE